MTLPNAPAVSRIRDSLVAWYEENRRDLPWRRDPTPYRVWVSEIMLQQTRVDVVVGYYERFLARFPTVEALASAPLEEVLEAWSGLGYYRRARHLYEGARVVIAREGARFPTTVEEALELPGIGRYTAGAILSIASGVRAPILDGNVIRILARLFGVEGDPNRGSTKAKLWSLAERMVEAGEPGTVNQAMMELGALVCLPRGARCDDCPLAGACVARRTSRVDSLPTPTEKRASVDVACAVLLVRDEDRVLLRRRGPDELLPGMWDLPGAFGGVDGDRDRPLDETVAALPFCVEVGERLGVLRHGVTYRRITLEVVEARMTGRIATLPEDFHWCTPIEAASKALSAPARKILAKWGLIESYSAAPSAPSVAAPVSLS